MEATQSRLTPALTVTGVLCVLLAVYAGSYLAIVRPQTRMYRTMYVVDGLWTEDSWMDVQPEYRMGGYAADWLFWPAHQVDRHIRLETWGR